MGNNACCLLGFNLSKKSSSYFANDTKCRIGIKKKNDAVVELPTSINSVHCRNHSCFSENFDLAGVKDVKLKSLASLQHISERDLEDDCQDPSTHPLAGPLFVHKSKLDLNLNRDRCRRKTNSIYFTSDLNTLSQTHFPRSNSSSSVYAENTVSHPDFKVILKSLSLAVYYNITKEEDQSSMNRSSSFLIFDEKLYPLSLCRKNRLKNFDNPDLRKIYRFIRTLFHSAQLTTECGIIALVYIERLVTYTQVDLTALTWKRVLLASILLASKVWDDQAVWNVDYCQILKDLEIDDINELERQFLEYLDFNTTVSASVYAKYYFTMRLLASLNGLISQNKRKLLSVFRAIELEARDSYTLNAFFKISHSAMKSRRCCSLENLQSIYRKSAIFVMS